MSAQGGATGSVHVNVFGGPGSGKSTMAYAVAAELKARGYTAECVGEVVKDCIYDAARGDQEAARLLDGSVESQEELYRRQSARERRLDGLVQFVVADSPAIMGLAYLAPDADEDRAARLAALAQDEFEAQESVNVIVAREGAYDPRARIHAEDEAERIDADVLAPAFYSLKITARINPSLQPVPGREGHVGAVRDGGPRRRGQGCGDGRRARLGREDRR